MRSVRVEAILLFTAQFLANNMASNEHSVTSGKERKNERWKGQSS